MRRIECARPLNRHLTSRAVFRCTVLIIQASPPFILKRLEKLHEVNEKVATWEIIFNQTAYVSQEANLYEICDQRWKNKKIRRQATQENRI